VALFAQGYYRTPDIHFDSQTGRGKPFHYYAFGAAVSEIEIDGFTGAYRLLRTDILQDVGDSISPVVDRGQTEGGFIQGVGWLTLEELVWDDQGRLATSGASTYKLPSWSEVPEQFVVDFLHDAREDGDAPDDAQNAHGRVLSALLIDGDRCCFHKTVNR
jgi:xanthine dehydrogenase large subunit